ncbi:proteasome assembly chaperone 2 [Bacillus rossius redtenbacheri]|uniref:proteasome assembly chaperone 2 n=1 Tax=Bacillus rossius redtenbacheri TaxID=93214 RepID=UPI002FDD3EC2
MMSDISSVEDMFKLFTDRTFKGYAFILPSVSVGNVGQLAMDLVLSSLTAVKIGYVLHPAILPVVGSDPYDLESSSLMISCEIFVVEDKKLILMQIRSPLIKTFRNDFLLKLLKWIQKMELSPVFILTSSHEYERNDEQIRGTPLRFLMTADLFSKHEETIAKLGWKELEKRGCPDLTSQENHPEEAYIPGGGFAKLLFDTCAFQKISSAVLLKFCSEGDNIPDAVLLANYLNDLIRLVPEGTSSVDRWHFPPSWKHLFGNAPDRELY